MSSPVLVAIDQGTSSTKAIAVQLDGTVVARRTIAIGRRDPRPGWVEQDADEILTSVVDALRSVLRTAVGSVLGIGLSTQRESAVIWDRGSGRALSPVLGWQDRRTSARARQLLDDGHGPRVSQVTGLPLDPMFSALKFEYLLDDVDPDRRRAARGELAVGTVDSFLSFHLTGKHVIEAGNASRTQLLDLDRVAWDLELLDLFRIPEAVLPEVVPSDASLPLMADLGIPSGLLIRAVLGDSHAALYGHGAREPGAVKVTYGTGSSIMGLVAPAAPIARGLARTIAWQRGSAASYAFEGNILATGATLVWLASLLGTDVNTLVDDAATVAPLHGVELVPAFAGLAAPWWSESAEALLSGFTLATNRATLARAAVDSVVLQVEDVLAAAEGTGTRLGTVLVDGGPSANPYLVQLQADLAQRRIRRSPLPELSALGVAALAAESAGAQIAVAPSEPDFVPTLDSSVADQRRATWRVAVARALSTPSPSVVADVVHA